MRSPLLRLSLAVALLAGCGDPAAPPPRTGTAASVDRNAVDALVLAGKMDPGPIALLTPELPQPSRTAFAETEIGRSPPKDKLRRERENRRSLLHALGKKNEMPLDDVTLNIVLEAIYALEPLVFATPQNDDTAEAASVLRFFYGLAVSFAGWTTVLPEMLQSAHTDAVQKAGLVGFFAAAATRGEKLENATAAAQLRATKSGPLYEEALAEASSWVSKQGDYALAVRIREEELRLRGHDASSFDYLGLASLAFGHLDGARGDAALAAAKEARPRVDDRYGDATADLLDGQLKKEEEQSKACATLSKTEGKPGTEERLGHARALFDLGLYDRAEPELAALSKDAPTDARPLVLRARTRVAAANATEDSIRAAAAMIVEAEKREKKEREFYEAKVGLVGQVLLYDFVKEMSLAGEGARPGLMKRVGELRGFAADLATYEPARAAVIVILIDLLDDMLGPNAKPTGETFAAYASRAEDLRKKFPESIEASELARGLGATSIRKAAALSSLDFPWPRSVEDDDLGRNLLILRVALGAKWNAPERLPTDGEIAQAARRSPREAGTMRVIGADAIAVRAWLSGDKGGWESAAKAYQEAFDVAPAAHRMRAFVNTAMAYAASGEENVAVAMLEKITAATVDASARDAASVGLLDLAALRVGTVSQETSELAFAKLASDTKEDDPVNIEARAFLAWLAWKRGDRAMSQKLAKEVLAARPTVGEETAHGNTPGVWAISRASFAFLVHFTPTRPSLYHLDLSVSPFIVWARAAPLTTSELQRLATGKSLAASTPRERLTRP